MYLTVEGWNWVVSTLQGWNEVHHLQLEYLRVWSRSRDYKRRQRQRRRRRNVSERTNCLIDCRLNLINVADRVDCRLGVGVVKAGGSWPLGGFDQQDKTYILK